MARIPQGGVKRRLGLFQALLLVLVLWPGQAPVWSAETNTTSGPAPLVDGPVVWYATDDAPIPVPAFAEPGLVPYAFNSFVTRPFSRFFHPGRFVRWAGGGDRARTAANINSLDEVVDSSWFTNRMGLYQLTDEELVAGPGLTSGLAGGPDRSQPWVIIGAKTAGVTPGFRIRDGRGDVWLLKFDPPHHPGMTIRSGVVTNLIFHAVGYNVPVDRLVEFDRTDLLVGEGATMKLQRHGKVTMTEANLDSLLDATNSKFDGRYQALASRFLDGIALGPFNDQGRREDDPNDTIKHQDRRELRGLRVFAAWVNHFDTKMHNSLDMYVGPEGQGHVRHYLIDFASTLGAFGDTPVKRFGYEFGLDFFPGLGRTFALGLHEDPWVNVARPEGLAEVGMLVTDPFEPGKWKPDLPNSMMANLTRGDGYWAAKIISCFTDAQLRLLVEQGVYSDPAAVDYLVATLAGRRDKIVRHWFDLVPPLDYFVMTDGGISYSDLAVQRGYAADAERNYRYRLAVVDVQRRAGNWSQWEETNETFVPLEGAPAATDDQPFLAVECQVSRDGHWSKSTTVYRGKESGRIVALER